MKRHVNSSLTVLVCLTFFGAMLIGCKKDAEEPEPEETTGAEIPEPEPEVEVEPMEEPCAFETVYFAFDSSELDSSARSAIQSAVECYRNQNPNVRLLLTGACDPRGTEEYNIALGERRAQSVRSYMKSLGMDPGQISITSVGEEMATGTDEASWALDRNVSATEQ
ncbi:MAG TPA: OmpA family protein [Polyangiales bacterium]|nr:OmpA family protein [Polyangiales bacterium]